MKAVEKKVRHPAYYSVDKFVVMEPEEEKSLLLAALRASGNDIIVNGTERETPDGQRLPLTQLVTNGRARIIDISISVEVPSLESPGFALWNQNISVVVRRLERTGP